MKVKVKGLVFVGFAAAILSANAMAADGDAKIVTSKLYVDSKFSGTAGQVITQGSSVGSTTYTDVGNDKNYINVNTTGTNHGSGVLVTGKAVKEALDDLSDVATNIQADDKYVEITDVAATSTTPAGKKVEVKTDNLAKTQASITATTAATTTAPAAQDKLVTASAVKAYSQPIVDKAGPAVAVRTGDGTSSSPYAYAWHTLQASGTQTSDASTTNYLTMTTSGTTKTLNLKAGQVASDYSNTNIASGSTKLVTGKALYNTIDHNSNAAISSSSGDEKVPTSKNVYEFVTGQISGASGNYQPKVADANHSTLMVGYSTRSGSGTESSPYTYSSDWKKLETAATAAQASVDYVTIKEDSGVYKLNIPSAQVGTAGSDVTSSSTKLTQGKAVYGYAQPKVTNTTGALQVGYRGSSGDATWKTLKTAADTGTAASSTNYVTMTESSGVYTVNLASGQIADSITTDGSQKLATENAVYDYVGSIIGGNLTIPAPSGECASANMTSSNDTACALVLAYWPVDTTNGITTAGVQLKWVKMAQAQ